jgi:hypothetical protein
MNCMITSANKVFRSIGGVFTSFYSSASSVDRRVLIASVKNSTHNRLFVCPILPISGL